MTETFQGRSVQDIKDAVDSGLAVHCGNDGYEVTKAPNGEYIVTYRPNGSVIGLTHKDGVTLNGELFDFYIGDVA